MARQTEATGTSPFSIEGAREALQEAAERIALDPQTNSVFAVAQKLYRGLKEGTGGTGDLMALARRVHLDLALARCERFREQHGLNAPSKGPVAHSIAAFEALADKGFDAFREAVERPAGGIVLTGHPTFALSRELRMAMATQATAADRDSATKLEDAIARESAEWGAQISLAGEHDEVQHGLAHAQEALSAHARRIIETARKAFPDDWRALRPALPTLASWVGYDLDGRTDIHWSQSVAFRLTEKALQLERYRDRLAALIRDHGEKGLMALHDRIAKALDGTKRHAEAFAADLTDPDNLVRAANALTADDGSRLTDISKITGPLRTLARDKDTSDELAAELIILAAKMDALQLGTARIHLRLNAAQLRTVIRRDLGLETEDRHLGRLAFQELARLARETEVRPVNFADLLQEQSTARRQFMMCAQILKHIDAGSPIRFLIAEAENPATVMGALFIATQYGVADKLDISPLFETPNALEGGARFISRLLEAPEYRKYLEQRGYLSVQFGFSDAGRFIGQVSADMAIERLHNLIGKALADAMPGTGLLLFNTHGESMGRGAWPGSFTDRYDHVLTPWSRANFARRGVPVRHEVSVQGGDGFLHFATPELADATVAAFAAHHLLAVDPSTAQDDPFYGENAFSWDFYRALRNWHETLFDDPDYGHLLGEFSSGFLVRAGSRQKRRSGGPTGPRALRAISHNATLQQLGIPVNTAGGIGAAIQSETDQLVALIEASPRLRHLVRLAQAARNLTSVPALRAYGEVYKPGLWVSLSRRESGEQAAILRRVAYCLDDYQTTTAILRMADKFSIELGKFDAVMRRIEDTPSAAERHESRLALHTLHAVRIAAMMLAFSTVGRLSGVSPRHDMSARDIISMVTLLNISEAAATLRDIYPADGALQSAYERLSEPGHAHTDGEAHGYDAIQAEVIAPLEELAAVMHQATLALSQAYAAWG